MTYNFKHIRLFENSPFKKISKSEKPADDLSAVRKVSANIIKENLSEKLYYILHLFYCHLKSINRGRAIKPETTLTGQKILMTTYGHEDPKKTIYGKLYCLDVPREYDSRDLEYIKNNVIIRITENGLYIKLPCIFDSFIHNINILNPRNTMTIKDVYVNQLKYILQYGYKDKNVQKYYEFLVKNIDFFDEENSNINISEIFNDIHEYLKYCSDNIDIKYVIIDNANNANLSLNLIDIQSIDDVNESFLSIFEPRSFMIDKVSTVTMINSFVTSTDYSEIKQLLHLVSLAKKCYRLYSVVVSDKDQLLYNINNVYEHNVKAEFCKNITMYDHYELNDLSIIPSFVTAHAILAVEDPKKCSFKTDILNSIPNTMTRFSSYIKDTSSISKFDILKAMISNDNHNFNDYTEAINEKVISSERAKNNTNNDKYSKFIKRFDISTVTYNIRNTDINVGCNVVASDA